MVPLRVRYDNDELAEHLAAVVLARKRGEALVVLCTGAAVAQVLGDRRKELVDVAACKLAFHVLGQERERSLAASVITGSPEQARDEIAVAHRVSPCSR